MIIRALKSKSLSCAAALLSLCMTSSIQAQTVELTLQSQRHSDATRLNEMDHRSAPPLRPRAGRNISYEDNELRLAYRQGEIGRAHV